MATCTSARLQARGDSTESAQLVNLLRLPVRANQTTEVADRARRLRALVADLPADRSRKLLSRLDDQRDSLGIFFDCELSTALRGEIREVLTRKASTVPDPRATGDRGTSSTAVADRATAPSTSARAGPATTAAPATTSSASQTAADCAKHWASHTQAARTIIGQAKPTEHRLRNMLITAHYALLYLNNRELKWSGFAAYASKQVGCAMDHTQRIARLAQNPTYYPMQQSDQDALDNWDELAITFGGHGAAELANYMYAKLGDGNQKLFLDIFPAHLFYLNHGYQQMARCAKARVPALPAQLGEGFRLIDEARRSSQPAAPFRASVAALARHEQLNILQPVIYTDRKMRGILDLNELDVPGADPAKAILTSQCTDPGDHNTFYLNHTRRGDQRLYDPSHRMAWILDRIAPEYFALEGSPRHIRDMNALTRILYQ